MRILLCLLIISCSPISLPKIGTCYIYSLPDLNPSYGTQRNSTVNYLYKYSKDKKYVYFRPGYWGGTFYGKVNLNWRTNFEPSRIGVMKTEHFLKLLEIGHHGGLVHIGDSGSVDDDGLFFKCSND